MPTVRRWNLSFHVNLLLPPQGTIMHCCTQPRCFTAEFLRKSGLEIKSFLCKKVKVSHSTPHSEGSVRKMLLLTSLARGHSMGQPAAPQHCGGSKSSFLVHLSDWLLKQNMPLSVHMLGGRQYFSWSIASDAGGKARGKLQEPYLCRRCQPYWYDGYNGVATDIYC